MAFTDEDLRELKKGMRPYFRDTYFQPRFDVVKFKAFLVRLDAAEKAVRHAHSCAIENDNPDTKCSCNVADWRNATGKE